METYVKFKDFKICLKCYAGRPVEPYIYMLPDGVAESDLQKVFEYFKRINVAKKSGYVW